MGGDLQIFMLAGEASGDHIGADIMRRLTARAAIGISGVGGEEMLAAGLDPYFDIQQLQVMGFADVIGQLPRLLRLVKTTADHIISKRFDGVVLVDYQEFSTLLAKRLKAGGYKGPVILAVAPSVWAWRPGRAPKLHGVFDEILSVLPFEPEVMARLGGPATTYIGHPASGSLPIARQQPAAGYLTLLPGSRGGELRRHMPFFRRVVERMHGTAEITGFALPTLPRLIPLLREQLAGWPVEVEIVTDPQRREEVYAQTRVALASSGTVTLELALRGIPCVGTYVPDPVQMLSYVLAGSPRILLPNVIAGQEVVPEALYGPGHLGRVVTALQRLAGDAGARSTQTAHFDAIREVMRTGLPGAKKEDAADRILAHLQR